MTSNTKTFLGFAAGVLIGSIVGILAMKEYFQEKANTRADEEIESMKEHYLKKEENVKRVTNEQIEKRAYEIITERYARTDDQKISEKKEKEETMTDEIRPYVIEPEEFGDIGYKTVSLNYYEDGVLTYENDDVITNVDEIVGKDSLGRFGEFEQDSVYVRNDELQTDFEILADSRRYSDIYC